MNMNRLTSQVIKEAHKDIGIVETTRNSGPEIDVWLRRVGQEPGASYCAAWAWCKLDDAIRALGYKNHLAPTASVHKLFTMAHQHHCWWPEPSPGFVFGIDHGSGKGHCGIVIDVAGVKLATVEANTNKAGEREGKYVMVRERNVLECTLGFLDPGLLLVGQTCSELHPEDG
jgi:hypothetical protein